MCHFTHIIQHARQDILTTVPREEELFNYISQEATFDYCPILDDNKKQKNKNNKDSFIFVHWCLWSVDHITWPYR
uniref:Uncharacterized protein n=1 Tax=Anguilla anguilla TaxID=7936 RepID=A0A0E9WX24_ANGAN